MIHLIHLINQKQAKSYFDKLIYFSRDKQEMCNHLVAGDDARKMLQNSNYSQADDTAKKIVFCRFGTQLGLPNRRSKSAQSHVTLAVFVTATQPEMLLVF